MDEALAKEVLQDVAGHSAGSVILPQKVVYLRALEVVVSRQGPEDALARHGANVRDARDEGKPNRRDGRGQLKRRELLFRRLARLLHLVVGLNNASGLAGRAQGFHALFDLSRVVELLLWEAVNFEHAGFLSVLENPSRKLRWVRVSL